MKTKKKKKHKKKKKPRLLYIYIYFLNLPLRVNQSSKKQKHICNGYKLCNKRDQNWIVLFDNQELLFSHAML